MNPNQQQPTNVQPPNYQQQQHDQRQYHQQQQQHLVTMVNNAQEVLFKADTVFPFTLFPDTITIDREKVTVTRRSFFKVGEVLSIHMDDILSVTADVGPFFGSVKIMIRFVNNQQPDPINYLKRKDVLRIKCLMQGYIIARQQGVDCGHMPKEQLVKMLQNLGGGVV
ncbi:MAG TPA: hypothetical protein VD735_01825 [Candidatus Saccharimonadales bacterium]|nr:hypothetical protein [Candidatus Saccharimonadales bacterium]